MLQFVTLALLISNTLGQSTSSLAAQATTFNCTFDPVEKPHEIVASCPRELYLGEETLQLNFFYNSLITNQTAVQSTIFFKLADKTVIYSSRGNYSTSSPVQSINFTIDPTQFRATPQTQRYSTIIELRIVSTADNATFISTVILPQIEIRSGVAEIENPTATRRLGPVATINLAPKPASSNSACGLKMEMSFVIALIMLF
jgi:hypothetical protein